MPSIQKRLLKYMQRRNMRVADLARFLGQPYTSVREWVLHGRVPTDKAVERTLEKLEKGK
jgi:hypothetical protein